MEEGIAISFSSLTLFVVLERDVVVGVIVVGVVDEEEGGFCSLVTPVSSPSLWIVVGDDAIGLEQEM